jgi:hypothetical protein
MNLYSIKYECQRIDCHTGEPVPVLCATPKGEMKLKVCSKVERTTIVADHIEDAIRQIRLTLAATACEENGNKYFRRIEKVIDAENLGRVDMIGKAE